LRTGKWSSEVLLAFVEIEQRMWPACMRNISTAGALIEAEADFPLEQEVLFRGASVSVRTRVVWRREFRFGLAFLDPLPAVLVGALGRRIVVQPFEMTTSP
jgi:hypothetical protein